MYGFAWRGEAQLHLSDVCLPDRTGTLTGDPEQYRSALMEAIRAGKTTSNGSTPATADPSPVINRRSRAAAGSATHFDITSAGAGKRAQRMAARETPRTTIEAAIAGVRERMDKLLKTVGAAPDAMKASRSRCRAARARHAARREARGRLERSVHPAVKTASVVTELSTSIAEIGVSSKPPNNVCA